MADLTALVRAHDDVFDSLGALAHELTEEQWALPTGCPGWSVRDVVAHVVGLEAVHAGEPHPADHVLPEGLAHVRDDLGRYMEQQVDVRRGRSTAELLAELDDVFARRRAWLHARTDLAETMPGLGGMGDVPLYRALPIRVFDLYAHEQDVRRAVGRPGHDAGPAADTTFRTLAKGLGASLPRRIDATGTVVIEVTGETAGTVAVDLATGLLPEPPEEPTVRLRLGFPEHVALGCGRADAPPLASLDVVGDPDLAAAVHGAYGITP